MAKNLCAAEAKEEAQDPGLPRYLISQLQPVPVLPQERVELLPAAIPLALARQPRVMAVKSNPQVAQQLFPEVASGSFLALAFLLLFWLLSPSQIFCLSTTPFSFAIFSSHSLVLASGWEIFSISLEQQLIQAFPSVLALASLPLPQPASFVLLLCGDSSDETGASVLLLDSSVACFAFGIGLGDFWGVGEALRFFFDLLPAALAFATAFGDFFGVGEACVSCWLVPDSSTDFSSSLLTCARRRVPAIAPSATAVASQRRKRTTATDRNRARDAINGIVKKVKRVTKGTNVDHLLLF